MLGEPLFKVAKRNRKTALERTADAQIPGGSPSPWRRP
jgi:hypothetical protein